MNMPPLITDGILIAIRATVALQIANIRAGHQGGRL